MKLDLTGIVDDGGYVVLNPGRYAIETKSPWYAKKSQAGNMVLRIPFTVLEEGEFKGAPNSYFHTIMASGAEDKIKTNKLYTYRLLASLGILSEEDRGEGGALGLEFEFGDVDDKGQQEVHSLIVNGSRRSLSGRYATAVVVVDNNREDGVSIKTLEPNSKLKEQASKETPPPQQEQKQSKVNSLF